jgi:hypothetical protein
MPACKIRSSYFDVTSHPLTHFHIANATARAASIVFPLSDTERQLNQAVIEPDDPLIFPDKISEDGQ